jgi:hypothetical protein
VALIGHPLFGWGNKYFAATPAPLVFQPPLPPSGARVLERLANQAAIAPAIPGAGRPYAYVKRNDWRLGAGPARTSPSHVIPTMTQSWLRADGSGRVRSVAMRTGAAADDRTLAPGAPLPAAAALESARRVGGGSPAAELAALASIADRQPIPPAAEAAMLRRLARLPDIVNSGTVVDRDGRSGEAVSITAAYGGPLVRYTLIFNPRTGGLLEADEVLAGDPGSLDVRDGSVIAYTTFLASGYTAGTSAP